VSKRDLLAEVWREPYGGGESTVDVHLSWPAGSSARPLPSLGTCAPCTASGSSSSPPTREASTRGRRARGHRTDRCVVRRPPGHPGAPPGRRPGIGAGGGRRPLTRERPRRRHLVRRGSGRRGDRRGRARRLRHPGRRRNLPARRHRGGNGRLRRPRRRRLPLRNRVHGGHARGRRGLGSGDHSRRHNRDPGRRVGRGPSRGCGTCLVHPWHTRPTPHVGRGRRCRRAGPFDRGSGRPA
jgi:hypothetical protein